MPFAKENLKESVNYRQFLHTTMNRLGQIITMWSNPGLPQMLQKLQ